MAEGSLVPVNRLGAVNVMLEAIGQRPISSLSVTSQADVAMAEQLLDNTNREVQSEGWDFNTDIEYSIALDGDSKIAVPADALSIDAHYKATHAVERGGFMWDRDNHTFVWDQAMKCDIIRFLSFSDLPSNARWYVTVKASRRFQRRMLGDEATERFTYDEEVEARSMMTRADSSTADRSAANDPALHRTVYRHRRRRYY